KERPSKRCDQIHPRLCGLHFPVVLNSCLAVSVNKELPEAASIELAERAGLDQLVTFDADYFGIEFQRVRQCALPRRTPNAAKPVLVAFFQLDDAQNAFPPFTPTFRMFYFVPNVFYRRVKLPNGHKFVVAHRHKCKTKNAE